MYFPRLLAAGLLLLAGTVATPAHADQQGYLVSCHGQITGPWAADPQPYNLATNGVGTCTYVDLSTDPAGQHEVATRTVRIETNNKCIAGVIGVSLPLQDVRFSVTIGGASFRFLYGGASVERDAWAGAEVYAHRNGLMSNGSYAPLPASLVSAYDTNVLSCAVGGSPTPVAPIGAFSFVGHFQTIRPV